MDNFLVLLFCLRGAGQKNWKIYKDPVVLLLIILIYWYDSFILECLGRTILTYKNLMYLRSHSPIVVKGIPGLGEPRPLCVLPGVRWDPIFRHTTSATRLLCPYVQLSLSYIKKQEFALIAYEPLCFDRYLDISNVLSAAVCHECTMLHPGYGFLAENANFVDICREHGINFIGPNVSSSS